MLQKKWLVIGTDTSRGSRDLDFSFEWAISKAEAWSQAVNRAAGTRFKPERIEEN